MPDEQAAPDDTATPSRSKAMTAVSAFMPGAVNSVVFGSRSAPAPKIVALGEIVVQPGFEQVSQRQHVSGLGCALTASGGSGSAECGDAGDILGAGAQPPLLAAAANERIGQMNVVAASNERADALRPADFMGRQRQQIRAERSDVAIDASRRLHRIDMEQAAGRMHDRGRFGDRLNDAGLVIGEHQRNQRTRRFRDRPRQRRKIEPPIGDRPANSSIASRGNRPPARTETCSMAESRSRERGRLSPAISIAGVSASILASVPLEVKNTSPAARRRARRPVRAPARSRAARRGPRRAPRTDCRGAQARP